MGVEIAMGWPRGTPIQFWEVREGFLGLMSPLTPKRWIGTNKVMWDLMRPSKRWEQHVQSPRGKEDQGSCTAAIQPSQAVDAIRKTEKKWTNFIFLHPYSLEFVSVSQRSQVEPRIMASCVAWLTWSYFFELTSDGDLLTSSLTCPPASAPLWVLFRILRLWIYAFWGICVLASFTFLDPICCFRFASFPFYDIFDFPLIFPVVLRAFNWWPL